jgi:glycosyltransferase involved in cell wall biosynthesis
MRTVLFYRDFRIFSGGHLKVWHYFNHVLHAPHHTPFIYFSKETLWDESNPWFGLTGYTVASPHDILPDVRFVAGLDWLIMDQHQEAALSTPVINFIQGVRHARSDDPRYPFLTRKAIRICVSAEVKDALAETGRVNGPLFVIPNGIDLGELLDAADPSEKTDDVLIVALKQPQLGQQVLARLIKPGRRIVCLATQFARRDFLGAVSRARVTVFLPHPTEGFYLPALEGMALGTLVVCPDCVGNRSFCQPNENCFRPEYTVDSIVEAAETALRLPLARAGLMRTQARRTVGAHALLEERKAFLTILENVKY